MKIEMSSLSNIIILGLAVRTLQHGTIIFTRYAAMFLILMEA